MNVKRTLLLLISLAFYSCYYFIYRIRGDAPVTLDRETKQQMPALSFFRLDQQAYLKSIFIKQKYSQYLKR